VRYTRACKILAIYCKGNIFNIGVKVRGQEIQWKTGHISETVRDRAKVTISH